MRTLWMIVVVGCCVGATAPAAHANERLLTLYSPPIQSLPYVHRTTTVSLAPDGRHAPAEPGFVLGFQEQVIVDSKAPDAKPLPINRMMIHHLLYHAPGRVDQVPGTCLGGDILAGRGEEHPDGRFGRFAPRALRDRYGIHNVTANGSAPAWRLTAMVMNHYRAPKTFYVRTRVWYTTEPRTPLFLTTVGNCAQAANGMAYDVPGGGARGSTFVNRSTWTVPAGLTGRILGALSHQHGGAIHQSLKSLTCRRTLLDAPAYYGAADHPYNTIRPILHEPGPIANGTFGSARGIPVTAGEVLERAAVHDNTTPHVAAMGFWVVQLVRDDSVRPCSPLPGDIRELTRPHRYDRTFPFVYNRRVPQLRRPTGPWTPFGGGALSVGDQWFRPDRIVARVGQRITWQFRGSEPHSVTVANGPRGFSSNYLGLTSGSYSFTPTVAGTYRLTCLIHPTTMSQTLDVR